MYAFLPTFLGMLRLLRRHWWNKDKKWVLHKNLQKMAHISRIWTKFVRIEGKHVDHKILPPPRSCLQMRISSFPRQRLTRSGDNFLCKSDTTDSVRSKMTKKSTFGRHSRFYLLRTPPLTQKVILLPQPMLLHLTRLQPRLHPHLQPRPRGSRLRRGIHLFMIRSTCSVTRLGEISPLWQNFKSIWATFKSFIYYLAKLRTFFD